MARKFREARWSPSLFALRHLEETGPPPSLLCGGFFSPNGGVKTTNRENQYQKHLANPRLYHFLEKVDVDLVEEVQKGGCQKCGGRLDRADYQRKPRGGVGWPEEPKRCSLCCAVEDCRRRHTPPSVRFLGRRVYVGAVVVLVAAMVHGLKPERIAVLRQALNISHRTLERWRHWWREDFVASAFWKAAKARFTPPLDPSSLPRSLCESFHGEQRRDRLLALLEFLAPLSTSPAWQALGN